MMRRLRVRPRLLRFVLSEDRIVLQGLRRKSSALHRTAPRIYHFRLVLLLLLLFLRNLGRSGHGRDNVQVIIIMRTDWLHWTIDEPERVRAGATFTYIHLVFVYELALPIRSTIEPNPRLLPSRP